MEWTQQEIKKLIEENKLYRFYKSKEWIALKNNVLDKFHHECQWCKEKGKVSRAETVHHVQYVKTHPELPLCHDCHDRAHERMKYRKVKQVNEERW